MTRRCMSWILSCCLTAALLAACGGSEECTNPEAQLFVTTRPSDGVAYASGRDEIKISVTGQGENCASLEGSMVEFQITDQEPEGVGVFENDGTSISVLYSAYGATTEVTSETVGTASVVVFVPDHNLSGLPVQLEFRTPPVTGQCGVQIVANPPVIEADGASTSEVTATLTSDEGNPMPDGTTVTFTTTEGKFTQSNDKNAEMDTTDSQATVTLQSVESAETLEAEVTATYTCDDGELHSGKTTVRFGEVGMPVVHLSASKSDVLADGASTVDLEAEVFMPGGARAGAGVTVAFFTDLGTFTEGGGPAYDGTTDDEGLATATFLGGAEGGTAHIRASVYIEDQTADDEIDINVRALGAVRFVSADPVKLGAKGSGRDESSNLTFQVLDTADRPFPAGALVEFEKSAAPGVTLDPLTDRTDDQGLVHTTLNSGTVACAVTVTATAHVGSETLSAVSPSIAIVGAKPNARYLTFSCEYFNVGGLTLNYVETECTVALADRYSNKIGFPTNVVFRTEAGSITAEALTIEAGNDMGMATITARTQNPRPENVPPVAGEPFIGDANPRDGLVTIIAATTGEEEFTDVNGNGGFDAGEPFVDMGEAFIDINDNGVRDPEEQFIDANSNSFYDPPNGVWDSDTLIWTTAHMLWTGEAVFMPQDDCGTANRYSGICPTTFSIALDDQMEFTWHAKDGNMNPINESLRVSVNVEGDGDLEGSSPPLSWDAPDTLGGWAEPNTYWNRCGGGFCGTFLVKGDCTEVSPTQGVITLELSYRQTPGGGTTKNDSFSITGEFRPF